MLARLFLGCEKFIEKFDPKEIIRNFLNLKNYERKFYPVDYTPF